MMGNIFKSEVEKLESFNPSFKGKAELQKLIETISQESEKVEFINIAGWVGIGTLNSYSSSSHVQVEESQSSSRVMLQLMIKNVKSLSQKYPKVLD
jgi:dTDP-glucose pyrophosphorylase